MDRPTTANAPTYLNGIIVFAVVLVISFAFRAYRIGFAPDALASEPEFTNVALQLLKTGQPADFFTHPIGYFLSLAVFFLLSGISTVSFKTIFLARQVDALYAALTVALLVFWLKKDFGTRVAFVSFVLLVAEPFTLYNSRLEIIDPQYIFFGILALYFFRRAISSGRMRDYHIFGLAAGLAIVTKEIMIVIYIIVIVFLFALRRMDVASANVNLHLAWVKVRRAMLITAIVYFAYVEWALRVGGSYFIDDKKFFLERLFLGASELRGDVSASAIFWVQLWSDLTRYGTTYALLLLSVPSIVYLVFYRRRTISTLILAVWAVCFDLVLFILLLPRGFSHTPYLTNLITPAVAVNSVALFSHPGKARERENSPASSRLGDRRTLITLVLVLLILTQNVGQWYVSYGTGIDNARVQTYYWIEDHVPAGSKLLVESTLFRMFLLSDPGRYKLQSAENVSEITDLHGVQFVVYESDSYAWWSNSLKMYVKTSGTLLAHFSGFSAGEVFVYALLPA